MSVKKIVILGPESTGKTTLAQNLAKHYNTVWCPEFAREYLTTHGTDYSYHDLLQIAMGQVQLEDMMLQKARNGLYFIDTDMYVMKVWCEVVFEQCHPWILKHIAEHKYDLFLLCNVDLPWVPDELREYPDFNTRLRLFKMYKDLMVNSGTRWVEVSGSHAERFQLATSVIDTVLR